MILFDLKKFKSVQCTGLLQRSLCGMSSEFKEQQTVRTEPVGGGLNYGPHQFQAVRSPSKGLLGLELSDVAIKCEVFRVTDVGRIGADDVEGSELLLIKRFPQGSQSPLDELGHAMTICISFRQSKRFRHDVRGDQSQRTQRLRFGDAG